MYFYHKQNGFVGRVKWLHGLHLAHGL